MGDGFAAVDWSKTYAYSLGLAGVYLNLKGREAGGILDDGGSEAERVRRAIQEGLSGFADVQLVAVSQPKVFEGGSVGAQFRFSSGDLLLPIVGMCGFAIASPDRRFLFFH